jgi:hypothetical protein
VREREGESTMTGDGDEGYGSGGRWRPAGGGVVAVVGGARVLGHGGLCGLACPRAPPPSL